MLDHISEDRLCSVSSKPKRDMNWSSYSVLGHLKALRLQFHVSWEVNELPNQTEFEQLTMLYVQTVNGEPLDVLGQAIDTVTLGLRWPIWPTAVFKTSADFLSEIVRKGKHLELE
jgi:hypothetical protein